MRSEQTADPIIVLHPGTPLVTASAMLTVAHLNELLLEHRRCLPIVPLAPEVTLAEAIARNVGGWRMLRYGTISRYIRSATLYTDTDIATATSHTLGGPTLKRATGYRLTHALLNHTLHAYIPDAAHARVEDVTLNLRPLPAIRTTLLLTAHSLTVACQYTTLLRQSFLPISALPFTIQGGGEIMLLVELEGQPHDMEQHIAQVTNLAAQHDLTLREISTSHTAAPTAHWQHWYNLVNPPPMLSMHLPQSYLAACLEQMYAIAQRYHLTLHGWGDLGTGLVQLDLLPQATYPITTTEQQLAATLLAHTAASMGARWATEWTQEPPPYAASLRAIPLPLPPPRGEGKWRDAAVSPFPSMGAGAGGAEYSGQSPYPFPHHGEKKNEHRATPPRHGMGAGGKWDVTMPLDTPHILTHPDDLVCYETDASIAKPAGLPSAVMLPSTTAQVRAIVQDANQHQTPIVTRGAGSGLAGGATPTPGCIILSLTRMRDIEIDPHQMVARVQAGAITADIQRAAQQYNLFYPPDPSSQAVSTIGGNIGCNAGGPRCLKYGVTADYVLGLTAVLANGQVVQLNDGIVGQAGDAGLMHLLIGSEGTLAVIIEATLRLVPMPPAHRTTLAFFAHLEDACTTVQHIIADGVIPAALELLDDTTIQVIEDSLHLGLPRDVGAMLLLQSDGTVAQVDWEIAYLEEALQRGGVRSIQTASTPAEEATLWKARRSIGPALAHIVPNKLGEDIVVPIPRIAETVQRIKAIATAEELLIPIFGHAGDGNLHPNILFHARDPEQTRRAWRAAEAIFAVALDVGGTLSGEHGIGTLKRPFMPAAIAAPTLALHRAVKAGLDPHNLLNPGKLLP